MKATTPNATALAGVLKGHHNHNIRWRLQPYVMEAVIVRSEGCRTVCNGGCSRTTGTSWSSHGGCNHTLCRLDRSTARAARADGAGGAREPRAARGWSSLGAPRGLRARSRPDSRHCSVACVVSQSPLSPPNKIPYWLLSSVTTVLRGKAIAVPGPLSPEWKTCQEHALEKGALPALRIGVTYGGPPWGPGPPHARNPPWVTGGPLDPPGGGGPHTHSKSRRARGRAGAGANTEDSNTEDSRLRARPYRRQQAQSSSL
jgi:hypothetical protein